VVTVASLLSGLLLSACGLAQSNQIAAMSPQELAGLSDRHICQGVKFNKSNANLAAEVSKRKLGDCSVDHFQCVSWGAEFGSPAYVQCRSQLRAASMQEDLSAPAPRQQTHYCYATGATAGVVATCQ
jgi:hypothetical protein